MEAIKITLVGDVMVGKTRIFQEFKTGSKITGSEYEYEPTIFDTYTTPVKHCSNDKEDEIHLGLWDTSGDSVYDEVRPICYPHTDCFIICFSFFDRNSFEHISEKWKPEIVKHGDGPNVPIILVGTKFPLQDQNETTSTLDEARHLQKEINAVKLFEYGAEAESVQTIMDAAISAAISKKAEEDKPKETNWNFQDLKFLLLGDSKCGKTVLLKSFTSEVFSSDEYEPTKSVNKYYADIFDEDQEYFLTMIDVPGDSASESVREAEYLKIDCAILCYDSTDFNSYDNIENKWLPWLKKTNPKVPIILVGLKLDLVEDKKIQSLQGEELMLQIGASAYIACSSKTCQHLKEVFLAAIHACS